MDNELLVKSVRDLCKKNNITPSQLESELKFGAGLISRWTKSSPSVDKIIDIADYFHVTLDEVVGRNQGIEDYENDIIIPLMQMTTNKEIQWEIVSNYDSIKIKEQSYDDIFCLLPVDEIEIYKCNFYDIDVMMTAYAFTPWGYIWASENPFLLYFEVFRLFTQMMSYVIFMTSL